MKKKSYKCFNQLKEENMLKYQIWGPVTAHSQHCQRGHLKISLWQSSRNQESFTTAECHKKDIYGEKNTTQST